MKLLSSILLSAQSKECPVCGGLLFHGVCQRCGHAMESPRLDSDDIPLDNADIFLSEVFFGGEESEKGGSEELPKGLVEYEEESKTPTPSGPDSADQFLEEASKDTGLFVSKGQQKKERGGRRGEITKSPRRERTARKSETHRPYAKPETISPPITTMQKEEKTSSKPPTRLPPETHAVSYKPPVPQPSKSKETTLHHPTETPKQLKKEVKAPQQLAKTPPPTHQAAHIPKRPTPIEPKKAIKKKVKPKKPFIPLDRDVPLLPREEVLWKGTHNKRSDNGSYVGFALAMSLAIYCFGVGSGARNIEPEYWNFFLAVLVAFIIVIAYMTRRTVEGHKVLSFLQVVCTALAGMLFALTFVSLLYEIIAEKYAITAPEGLPEQFMSLQNLPISSLFFVGVLLLLFAVISALKSETPKGYKANFTVVGFIVLVVGFIYLIKPEYLADREEHKIMVITLFSASLIVFSSSIFIALSTKKTMFNITNLRIVVVKEYFGKEAWMRSYNEIEDVRARQGFLGKSFDYGDVILYTLNAQKKPHLVYLHGVPEPFKVENMIYTRLSMLRGDKET